ncbi:MAG: phosphoheptose isomerase, partial [Gammaproteobacteria bacterium]
MSDSRSQLQALYPFLQGGEKDPSKDNAALLESVTQKSAHSLAVKQRFFADNAQAIVDTAKAIAAVYRVGGRLFSMGNGGSSCDAA